MPTDAPVLDAYLPDYHFVEVHRRVAGASPEAAWAAAIAVAAREVRVLGPLMALRNLPRKLRGRAELARQASEPVPLLDVFVQEGFVALRRDATPEDGHAAVVLGAAGRFWSPAHNQPLRFEGPRAFADFAEPGFAKVVVSLEVREQARVVELSTETRILATDARARRRFAPYWALIRGPSGLIRRSWLAAIDRRSRKSASERSA